MANIRKIDPTAVAETLLNTYRTSFEITDYADSTNLSIAAGTAEDLRGALYIAENGDFAVDTSALAGAGWYYVHVRDDGTGNGLAYVNSNSGTFDPNQKGWFYALGGGQFAKVCFQFYYTGSNYTNKSRTANLNSIEFKNDMYVSGDIHVDNISNADNTDSVNFPLGVQFAGNKKIVDLQEITGSIAGSTSININYPTGYTYTNTHLIACRYDFTSTGGGWLLRQWRNSTPGNDIDILIFGPPSGVNYIALYNNIANNITYYLLIARVA